MTPTKTTTPLSATRVEYSSSTPFATVEARIRASIQQRGEDGEVLQWSGAVVASRQTDNPKESFAAVVNKTAGPHGFILFYEINHGGWLPIFKPATNTAASDGRQLKSLRFILGNPLIAYTMIQHDLNAGAFAPVEFFLVEQDDGGSRILYFLPSGLIAGYAGAKPELKAAVSKLDQKLETLIKDVLAEDSTTTKENL